MKNKSILFLDLGFFKKLIRTTLFSRYFTQNINNMNDCIIIFSNPIFFQYYIFINMMILFSLRNNTPIINIYNI